MHVIGVKAVYRKQTACPGHFACITLDFEPWPEYAFVNALAPDAMEYPDSQARFVPVIDATAHDELENHFGAGPLPVRVTLRDARDHLTDSNDTSFRVATVRAVRLALDRTGRERLALDRTGDERLALAGPFGVRAGRSLDVRAVRPLLDDPRSRFQALELCRDLFTGPPSDTVELLRPLARLVASPDDRVALRAVRVLAGAPHRRALDLVAGALARPAGEARDRAVFTLAERGDPRAAEPLAEILARDRLPKDVEWPVHAMKAHASVLLPPIRAHLEAAVPGALDFHLFELVCRISHWGAIAAPLAPSLRRLAADDDGWTSRELARALDRIAPSR
ncbi:HEAT repeat domain-containing protein [Actinomadura sp. LOL_016]|uniref:HEAT repeat domain-containing protein n=1 Tax=unclassified Actinomadura TaxID=2626254 RepID=UPI003A810FAA